MAIPASQIVTVNPSVIGSGGNSLSLNGVILSKNLLIPVGTVPSFSSSDAVKAYFGDGTDEHLASINYFLGYDNSTIKPSVLYFAPFVDTARSAWLRGGSLAGMTLTQLQSIAAGTIIYTMNGTVKTSSSINLSSATSFSNAATLISAAFTGGAVVTWSATQSAFIFTSTTTGTGSTMTFATGTLVGLKLTSADGAVLSQGAAVYTPSTALNAVKAYTQNWATFMTIFEPLIADKTLFAEWANAENQRYAYICWDTDAQAIVHGSTTAFGVLAKAAAYNAVICVYNNVKLAAFVLGSTACIDFSRANARITYNGKSQSGFTATVTDATIASNLKANGYSFYGNYATANDTFNFFVDGAITGKWLWLDTFVNQVYMNSQFQLAMMTLITNTTSIPYNEAGYSLVRAAMQDPIGAALNFGAIRTGVVLSAQQKAIINQSAGRDVANSIYSDGYYLQILDPGAQVRGNRGTPVINFWYADGGAVHTINIASIAII